MKIQDVIFIIIFGFIFLKRDPRLAVICGLLFLIISIPLFSMWIFFTAERFIWYSGAFFIFAVIFYIRQMSQNES